MATPKHTFLSLCRDQRGVAALEMAITLPFLLTLMLGVLEISNFVLATQRTEKMAYTVADLVSQNDAVTTTELNAILAASSEIMKPFPFGDRGHVIITSVHRNPNQQPKVAWQYEGGGTLHEDEELNSQFGDGVGIESPLPEGFTLNERETVIIAEVFYKYPAFITDMFRTNEVQLYRYAFYKPRLGSLETVQTQ
jgi:hypothetical protein